MQQHDFVSICLYYNIGVLDQSRGKRAACHKLKHKYEKHRGVALEVRR